MAGRHAADDHGRRRCRPAGTDPPCAPQGPGGDPVGTVAALYRHFGLTLAPTVAATISAMPAASKRRLRSARLSLRGPWSRRWIGTRKVPRLHGALRHRAGSRVGSAVGRPAGVGRPVARPSDAPGDHLIRNARIPSSGGREAKCARTACWPPPRRRQRLRRCPSTDGCPVP